MDSFEFEYKTPKFTQRYRFDSPTKGNIRVRSVDDCTCPYEQPSEIISSGIRALLARVDALETELAAAKAECERLQPKQRFIGRDINDILDENKVLRASRDEWAEKHCQLNENYDFAIAHHVNERNALRAEVEALKKRVAEAQK